MPPVSDPVNHPAHYTAGSIECIDAIEAALTPEQFIGYCRGNALKYLWRMGLKGDKVQDGEKARWYVNHLLDSLHGELEADAL
jgi:hypothetical protein